MTETNAKIHVLADETLGGIKREYVEVGRDISARRMGGYVQFTETPNLEPTNIVHIDGKRYEMVEDNAEKGDIVIVTDSYDFPIGHVDTVKEVDGDHFDGSVYLVEGANDETYLDGTDEDYRVLVPVETAEADEPQPADLIDVVSNLATRVADLERENKKLRAALDEDMKIRSENTRRYLALKDEIDTLHKDNRTLGEELARLKEPAKNESIIESSPFVLVIHEGRGEFDVYQRGKKIDNISRLEIEAYSRLSSSINFEFSDVGDRP